MTDEPLRCGMCGKTFNQRHALDLHRRDAHPAAAPDRHLRPVTVARRFRVLAWVTLALGAIATVIVWGELEEVDAAAGERILALVAVLGPTLIAFALLFGLGHGLELLVETARNTHHSAAPPPPAPPPRRQWD